MLWCCTRAEDNGQRHTLRYILETELTDLGGQLRGRSRWERDKLRMSLRDQGCMITFEGFFFKFYCICPESMALKGVIT